MEPAADELIPSAPRISDLLREAIRDLFLVYKIIPQPDGILFTGRLLADPERSYTEIERRLRPHGYTPVLGREAGEDILLAQEGLIEPGATGNPLLNLALLVATIFTTLAAGAQADLWGMWRAGADWAVLGRALLTGWPFSLTLLAILGVHELGHYAAARWHGVRVTLPYFIPVPGLGLGTFGAFIAIKSPMRDRKVLFDIGVAGPLAGFVVALPLLLVGLALSEVGRRAAMPVGTVLGRSLLMDAMMAAVGKPAPNMEIIPHPVFFAAWIGLLVTGINLLPVGQLDGGHIAYALFGRGAYYLAQITVFTLIAAGLLVSSYWLMWSALVIMSGLRHPPPLNDVVRLDRPRHILGWLAILLFFIVLIPIPFQ